jgi:hypothetical protein
MKLDFKPSWKFVRERQIPPGRCVQGSYLTASPAPGLRVVTCKDKRTGMRTTQTILHHRERFRIRHPELWEEIERGGTVDLRGRKHGYGSIGAQPSSFGGMFGEDVPARRTRKRTPMPTHFKDRAELMHWFLNSDYFWDQVKERKQKNRERYLKRKARQKQKDAELRARGIDPVALRRKKRAEAKARREEMKRKYGTPRAPKYITDPKLIGDIAGFGGMFAEGNPTDSMTFETDSAVLAFMHMIGPKGYNGMFGE